MEITNPGYPPIETSKQRTNLDIPSLSRQNNFVYLPAVTIARDNHSSKPVDQGVTNLPNADVVAVIGICE